VFPLEHITSGINYTGLNSTKNVMPANVAVHSNPKACKDYEEVKVKEYITPKEFVKLFQLKPYKMEY